VKKVPILALLVLFLAVGVLPAAAITWGEPDGEGHPNVGLLITDENGEPAWRCTGTLIAPAVFLTAGHCVEGTDGARVWFDTDMRDNDEYPNGGETSIEGTAIIHPEYGAGGSDPHDVALVILDEAVDIEPASLPDPGFLDQLKKDRLLRAGGPEAAKFVVVGYGNSLSWPPPETWFDRIRQVAESEYVALTKPWLHMSQLSLKDDGGTCGGDSGGPAFWVDEEAGDIVVAVTSWGDPNCVATGFNYRVDTLETLEWIHDNMP
jgi:secreted trypsin-like serine protease